MENEWHWKCGFCGGFNEAEETQCAECSHTKDETERLAQWLDEGYLDFED